MIEVKDLNRYYDSLLAVDSVNFKIEKGEVVGLLGHNGAGKTTIMKMLTGFLEPSSGEISIDGLKVGPDTGLIQKKMGYLPENCPVWPEMTVIDYLEYQALLHKIKPNSIPELINKAITKTALQEKATSSIQTLSRGFRQRVGVAQALLHMPDIIILDEPTNGLDPTQILHMRDLIKELAETATIIVSTHVLQEVQAVCERVLIMRSGKLVIDSKISELQASSKLLLTIENTNINVADELKKMKSIGKVEKKLDDNLIQVFRIETKEDLAPAIIESLVALGVKIRCVNPERRDLETVFSEVSLETDHE
jgi:ABC-2 type transport system ATP-binding protein